jgi:propanol-preferring alcohol dehydrogenase
MKAAVVTAFKKPLEIKQVEIPKPGPNDVLVKLIACGVCHTDIHVANGGKKRNNLIISIYIIFIFS